MRRAICATALLATFALPAAAQQLNVQLGPGGAMMQTQSSGAISVAYRPSQSGGSGIKVAAPPGARIRILDGGGQPVAGGGESLWAPAAPGRVYQVVLAYPDGSSWSQLVTAQPGMTALVVAGGVTPNVVVNAPPPAQPIYAPMVGPPPPTGPMPMADGDFARLVAAIQAEAFPENKLNVLRTAAQGNAFTCRQVGQLVDLYAFPDDKVKAVRITRAGIVDPQNGYTIYGHFTFPDDKEKVRHILAG